MMMIHVRVSFNHLVSYLFQILVLELFRRIKDGLVQHGSLDGVGQDGAILGEHEAVGAVVIFQREH